MPQNLGVILRKTTGFGGLGPCPLDAQWKNKEFLKNLAGVRPLGGYCPPSAKVRGPRSDIYIYTHICRYIYIWSKGDDVILINSHMTNEEYYTWNFKFKTPISKLQIQDFKKNFEKKKSKKILSVTFQLFQLQRLSLAFWNVKKV